MDTTTTNAAVETFDADAEAARVVAEADPDGPTVSIRAAWRNLSCAGSGPEAYRKVRYPGSTEDVWPDSDRLPAQGGFRASERRATVHCSVPVGTLVTTYYRDVFRGRRGRCSVEFGIAIALPDGTAKVVGCPHRTLRSRPVYEVALPDGSKVDVPRRVRA